MVKGEAGAFEVQHSAVYLDAVPYAPYVEEHMIDGPEPIERTLYLNREPLAVAYLDSPETEATLAWPLSSNVQLADILDRYLTDFLPQQRPKASESTLELWVGDRYYQMRMGLEPTTDLVLGTLKSHEGGPLRLLQISSESSVMELLFDESTESPVRLALLISTVCVGPLARLFSAFHKNDVVRNNFQVAVRVFAPDLHQHSGRRGFLAPLPICVEV
jgi:hypothetical protein